MRGQLVIIRDFKGKPAIRRIWDEDSKAVYVVTEDGFKLLSSGGDRLIPIGFPISDVFAYEPGIELEIEKEIFEWSKLKAVVLSST